MKREMFYVGRLFGHDESLRVNALPTKLKLWCHSI